ncbi:extensin family protein [Croceibacterium sp. LX-88]|uniref:Extensin family protein n=1 Tax=Croceibacterium selenioxidans TaxID=2838833 RepID=A0ABS5W012_9SPHN|nr:extensin family protein [Croceibacterium selenioxidans]MBT2133112.1 extensin family protein [Croceibacterium selenioxidans]
MVRTGLALICAALVAGCSAVPEERGRQTTASSSKPLALPAPRSAEAGQCLSRLVQMGAHYTPLDDQYLGQGCSLLGSVQLSSLASDSANLGLSNIGPVTCEVSQVFSGWARYGVDRAARQILGSPVRTIETMGSYSCRNVAGTGRRSGHATGAAIDVSGFVLEDGRRITVKGGWFGGTEKEQQFLRTVQQSACKRFDTVLGPDYNSAHNDHLHVEGVIGTKAYCR